MQFIDNLSRFAAGTLADRYNTLKADMEAREARLAKLEEDLAAAQVDSSRLANAEKIAAEALEKAAAAEADKQKVMTEFVVGDYLAKSRGQPEPKREFDKHGQLIKPVENTGFDMTGLSYLRDVKPNMREKIVNHFVSMGDILYDTVLTNNLKDREKVDMYSSEYLAHNVPPPTNIKTTLELFNRLFYFASFYLQKFPGKTISFFDYLMFLVEHSLSMSLTDLVELDHKMRIDFWCNLEWNWSQGRNENRRTMDRIFNAIRLRQMSRGPDQQQMSNFSPRKSNFSRPSSTFTPGAAAASTRSPAKAASGGKPAKRLQKPKVTEDMVKHEVCIGWNGGSCPVKPPKRCWHRHVCMNPHCRGDHMGSGLSSDPKQVDLAAQLFFAVVASFKYILLFSPQSVASSYFSHVSLDIGTNDD